MRVDGAQETVTLGGEKREWRKEIQGSIEVAFGDWTWRESVLMERGLEATLAGAIRSWRGCGGWCRTR